MLAVTDAVILAPMVSGVVFVVGSEMTRRVHAERALETLQSGRPRSIGVVLNRVDFDRNKYYYSRYYGYQYKSYYGQRRRARRSPASGGRRARLLVLLLAWTTFAFAGVYLSSLIGSALLLAILAVACRPLV